MIEIVTTPRLRPQSRFGGRSPLCSAICWSAGVMFLQVTVLLGCFDAQLDPAVIRTVKQAAHTVSVLLGEWGNGLTGGTAWQADESMSGTHQSREHLQGEGPRPDPARGGH